jgi:hypothetical protein
VTSFLRSALNAVRKARAGNLPADEHRSRRR